MTTYEINLQKSGGAWWWSVIRVTDGTAETIHDCLRGAPTAAAAAAAAEREIGAIRLRERDRVA